MAHRSISIPGARILKPPSREWWDEFARNSPDATFFHTPIWSEIARRCFGSTDRTLGFEFANGTCALIPMVERFRHRRRPVLESSAEGCYGDVISTGALNQRQLRVIRWAVGVLGYHTLEILDNPLRKGPAIGPRLRSAVVRSEPTFVVDLADGFDAAFERIQPRLRTQFRKGRRLGVEVEPATSIDAYRAHFEAYRDAVDRWGEGADYGYEWRVFSEIRDVALQHHEEIRLWVAKVDDDVVGGRLVFYWNGRAVLWHGSANRMFLDHHVVPVLDIEIARDAARRGCYAYDLNTTGDHPGVVHYKRKFRPVEIPLTIRSHRPAWARGTSRLRSRLSSESTS